MIRTIQLTRRLPSDWIAAQKGRFINESYFDPDKLYGSESVNVLKPDGSLLLLFRKGILTPQLCEDVRPSFYKAGLHGSGTHRPYQSATIGYYDDCRTTYFTAERFNEWLRCVPFDQP